jgi:hypothetical protein
VYLPQRPAVLHRLTAGHVQLSQPAVGEYRDIARVTVQIPDLAGDIVQLLMQAMLLGLQAVLPLDRIGQLP